LSRDYPEHPRVGVGVVVWRGDKVLLVRRARPPQAGEWSLPGGGQELGETLAEAARREVAEETGLAIRPTGVLTAVDSIHRDDAGRVRFHYTLIDLVAEWRAGEAEAGDDVDAVRWATPDEAEALVAWSETRRVIRLAAEARRLGMGTSS
jgi:ADP-ribose pyrophosphatase YjhB (NUDIX family)